MSNFATLVQYLHVGRVTVEHSTLLLIVNVSCMHVVVWVFPVMSVYCLSLAYDVHGMVPFALKPQMTRLSALCLQHHANSSLSEYT